ncbi:hypothetical protein BZL42_12015 [Pseudomonas indica]|nr:hypothetical protein BZL42_12015 [Pseudomonas indica]
MVWNAQHMDNQSTLSYSTAFKEKMDFLTQYLGQIDDVDVLAFLETGKTGKINQTLASALNNLPGNYVPIAHLAQEGGLFKDTTLGISVYVRSSRETEFSPSTFEYTIGDKERRAPVIIRHKATEKYLAFYHANASERTSFGHIKDAIEFINSIVGRGNLVFFGGDMNYDFHAMNGTVEGLTKLGPNVATHTKFELVKKSRLAEKMTVRYEGIINRQGLKNEFNGAYSKRKTEIQKLKDSTSPLDRAKLARIERMSRQVEKVDSSFAMADAIYDRQYSVFEDTSPREGIVVTNRFLDYAFVRELNDWTATCHGTVAIVNNPTLGIGIATRLCNGLSMRSDHFPVIYEWTT